MKKMIEPTRKLSLGISSKVQVNLPPNQKYMKQRSRKETVGAHNTTGRRTYQLSRIFPGPERQY